MSGGRPRFAGLAANCSMLFSELPLLERPAAARAAGFDAVELWWPFSDARPTRDEIDAFRGAVADAGVRLSGLNFFAGAMAAGERGVVSVPGREAEFRASVEIALEVGAGLGCGVFNALYGNAVEGRPIAEQREVALANLVFAARAAADVGGWVVVEPLSGCDGYPLRTAADAVEVVGEVRARGEENVGLLADLYHLAVNGEDLAAVVARHASDVVHVQVADAPGRHEPGSGGLGLGAAVNDLVAAGYQGVVGLEYLPSTTTAESLARLSPDLLAACAALDEGVAR